MGEFVYNYNNVLLFLNTGNVIVSIVSALRYFRKDDLVGVKIIKIICKR